MKQARKTKVEQARDWLLKEIRNGNFPRGTALPPERELAEQVGVSYMTLRKAVGMLVDENFLDRNHGSGTYVRSEISETKVQKQLGLVLPAWSAPETLDMIMYLSEACQKENWLLRVIFARSWEERSILDLWQSCDAVVCSAVRHISEIPPVLAEKVANHSKPFIFNGANVESIGGDSVICYLESLHDEVAEKLSRLGHSRILLVDQVTNQNGTRQTLHPSLTSFWEHFRADRPGTHIDNRLMSLEIPLFELAHHTIRRKLAAAKKELRKFSAIVCPLSFYWGVVSGVYAAGLRIPEDISVLTFGDRQEAEFYHPRPATLSAPLRDQAFRAMELVRWREQNPDAPPRILHVKPKFVVGETLIATSQSFVDKIYA